MGSGDWSNDLVLGNPGSGNQIPGDLAPASAVRQVESHAVNQEASGAARRRARRKEDDADDESSASEQGEQPEHRLDHLA